MPICVCVVVLDAQNRVAMTARRFNHNLWGLPGGKTEPKDFTDNLTGLQSCKVAATRELREETGLGVNPDDLNLVYSHQEDNLVLTFLASKYSGDIHPQEGEPPACWSDSWDSLLTGAFAQYNTDLYNTLKIKQIL